MRRGCALALLGICWMGGLQAATGEEEALQPETVVEDRLTVTGTRLRDRSAPAEKVPANITVIDAERIERAGVQTLQDLLSLETGVVVYDQTGNDVAKTLDLRGFTGGTGTRVYLDGAPLNSSRNNGLALELVPLTSLERIEITRGPSGSLGGGGSEAGIIRLFTRRGESFGGRLSVAAGDFGTEEYRADLRHASERLDLSLAGSWYGTEGFRDNAGGDLGRLAANVGYDLGGDRRLSLALIHGNSDFGTPGALTVDELRDNAGQAPFNSLDFANEGQTQGTLGFLGPLSDSLSLAANLFYRDRDSEVLSTGRAAPVFGGFYLDSAERVVGSTAQVGHRTAAGVRSNDLHVGLEWLDGETDAAGFFTQPGDPGSWDPASPSSLNTATRTTTAAFIQDALALSESWSLSAGVRYDSDEVGYRESQPDPNLVDSRSFSELSMRAGVTWTPAETRAVWLSYGEAFLPPTAEQLFSFPLFGSNPTLEAEDSSSIEFGFRQGWMDSLDLELTLFRTETRNEIVFDPDAPEGLFGANVNAGESLRQGLEASFRGPVSGVLEVFANLTLMSAEFVAGDNEGNRVPLVPDQRFALGFHLDLPAHLRLRAEGLFVGDQVLDNDEANTQAKLDAYTVVNARLTWAVSASRSNRGDATQGFELYVEARNLFDESYATRGIYAFDFSSFNNEIFVTPAPGRRVLGGVQWRF